MSQGQTNGKRSSHIQLAGYVNGSAVFLYDAIADEQPQSRAFTSLLGGIEGFENPVQVLAGDSTARISEDDF